MSNPQSTVIGLGAWPCSLCPIPWHRTGRTLLLEGAAGGGARQEGGGARQQGPRHRHVQQCRVPQRCASRAERGFKSQQDNNNAGFTNVR